jgi:hypothetical protein
MTYHKILLFFTLIAYSAIISQSFMYVIALKHVQTSMPAGPYIQLRKLLDNSFRANFKFVVYSALLFNVLLITSSAKDPGGILFIGSLIALIALATDILLALKGNMPINELINTWTTDNYPDNWATWRTKWLKIFQYRAVCNIIGFTVLLAVAIFRSQ